MIFCRIWTLVILAAAAVAQMHLVPSEAAEMGLPAQCMLGFDCFIQQYPDMDSGSGAVDPFCGPATYDGHDGTDLRVLSMKDVARGVAVVAMAEGRVLRSRDGMPDDLVQSAEDRQSVKDRECGNGIVIQHVDGFEVQYCHLKQGSVLVASGSGVTKGKKIGEVGASGLAQFPHVHVTLLKAGIVIDPWTGKAVGTGCEQSEAAPATALFSDAILQVTNRGETQLLSLGLAGSAVDYDALAITGPPPLADRSSSAIVGWAWFQNLRAGDRISVELADANGGLKVAETQTKPMERSKASYSIYAGKRGAPVPGSYTVTVILLRGDVTVIRRSEVFLVE